MNRLVFLNIAWMERYEGLQGVDSQIRGGGSYVNEHGYSHEIYNFKNINGKVYGYAQPSGYNNLQRLGADADSESLDNVLIVFTATYKNGGTYIVGWYKNATFFRNYQSSDLEERKYKGNYIGYYAVANINDAFLIPVDKRFSFPQIPRRTKGGMGQSNVWYADSIEMVEFRENVIKKIKDYEEKKSKLESNSISRQANVELRKKVENIAINTVIDEYQNRGFSVISVESENKGWDLEADYKNTSIKIEVKGLSGTSISVELTANEFENMKKHRDTYRLAVVTECLNNPILNIFFYSTELNEWISEDGDVLSIDTIILAKCYI
ncbi:DUF3883 domain-containing protein [Clostridium tetani]|uniref:DUF3883 domain-containing protein n=1 Tax=Clostridium tetani TaxID=1513 RepID=A0ABY0EQJ0_CLOTA|nr:DUF3883 domain-containing protein [Clostridium tetani]RXI57293.1 DUF3883 domain-containing protein [Clostridium tetani]RXI74348.1 DUF3883 domain-containing protein [Clostridium tetani]